VLQVRLLKDTLEAWKAEVEKKPPTMSITDAYETLELPTGIGQYVIVLSYLSEIIMILLSCYMIA